MITGWEHSVESMQVGEMVDLKCAPEFAYGQQGSPPSIPPDATLTCGTLSKPRHRLRPAGSSQATVSARSRQRPRGASGRIGHSAEAGICIGICSSAYVARLLAQGVELLRLASEQRACLEVVLLRMCMHAYAYVYVCMHSHV